MYNQEIKRKSVYPAVLIADSTDGARVFIIASVVNRDGPILVAFVRCLAFAILLIYSTLADGLPFEFSNFPSEMSSHK